MTHIADTLAFDKSAINTSIIGKFFIIIIAIQFSDSKK